MKFSLKTKLVFLTMAITGFLGFSSLYVLRMLINHQEQTQLNFFESNARQLSDALGAQFYERYGDVQAFAINPDIQSNDRETIISVLNNYAVLYGIYDIIMVVDKQGKVIAVNSKDPSGKNLKIESLYNKNFKEAPWFQETIKGSFTEDKEDGFANTYVENIQIDPITTEVFGESRLGSSFSTVIKNKEGKTIGVITNRAASRWFEVAFKEIQDSMNKMGYTNLEVSLFNNQGVLLFEYTPALWHGQDVKYDFSRLLKYNFLETGLSSAKNAASGQIGSSIESDSKNSHQEVIGYAHVDGKKFPGALGWNVLVKDSFEEALASSIRLKNLFYVIFIISVALSILAGMIAGLDISKKINLITRRLTGRSHEVSSAAQSISQSSHSLSESTTEQAAAIQETASSIDQVSAMVKKSAENASLSREVSSRSKETTELGQKAIQEMLQVIQEISNGNTAIMDQINEGNVQLENIVKVISEIDNKTKVINDIVFQTKLLSFNASVEAARAGEHGKGFAVVAEEVGNLAQMSGNAAKEISTMLDSSIQKVSSIVKESRDRVEKLAAVSKEKVELGVSTAQKCESMLEKILNAVQEVDGMIVEIATASQEQSIGVSEINKAINQLNEATQKNSSISQETASSAQSLSTQSTDLTTIIHDLNLMIDGKNNKQHDEPEQPFIKPTEQPSYHSNNVVPFSDHKKVSLQENNEEQEEPHLSKTTPSRNDPRFIEL